MEFFELFLLCVVIKDFNPIVGLIFIYLPNCVTIQVTIHTNLAAWWFTMEDGWIIWRKRIFIVLSEIRGCMSDTAYKYHWGHSLDQIFQFSEATIWRNTLHKNKKQNTFQRLLSLFIYLALLKRLWSAIFYRLVGKIS